MPDDVCAALPAPPLRREVGPDWAAPAWPNRAARFYAQALDRSDYGAAAARALRAALGEPAGLLDLGAGAGHPMRGWLQPSTPWLALEPNRYLRARLGRLARTTHPGLCAINARWQALPKLGLPRQAVALAANTGGPLGDPIGFLALMRAAAGMVAWIVPAQRGPKRWCLSGALPAALHGESERPAVEAVLEALGSAHAPHRTAAFDWTFRARFADAAAAEAHCAGQLAFTPHDPRRPALVAHLAAALRPLPEGGLELAAPKRSALLVWDR